MSERSASVSSGFPNARKHLKARSRRLSDLIVFECFWKTTKYKYLKWPLNRCAIANKGYYARVNLLFAFFFKLSRSGAKSVRVFHNSR